MLKHFKVWQLSRIWYKTRLKCDSVDIQKKKEKKKKRKEYYQLRTSNLF